LGSIGRTKVQDDELEIRESLAQNAFDRLGKKPVDVTHDHDDGHQGLIHFSSHLRGLQHIYFDLLLDIDPGLSLTASAAS
jgi:hypothetical protein